MTYKILVVDDEPANLRLLERLFRRDFTVITANSGQEALELLGQHDVALIISDQRMPGMTGIELLKKTVPLRPHLVRIILTGYTDVGALVEAINCGHVYKYVTKPWNNDELRVTVERALQHYETIKSRNELEQLNRRLSHRLEEMTHGLVRAIADALEAKDEYVSGHGRRVSGYATAIARRMHLDMAKVEEISLAALLHDIGKIGTPESLLLKPAPLNPEERAIMQLHSERGARILGGVPEMAEIADAVRHHHEHFDGSGYPEGLAGTRIPLASRIILVADAYDALTSPRPFREAWDHDAAVARLRVESGKRFDPDVVEAFCGLEALAKIRKWVALGQCGPRPTIATRNEYPIALADLVRDVKRDPVIAANILRQANINSGSTSKTADILGACAQLGEDQVCAVAQNIPVDPCADEIEELLTHSIRCALAAEKLAEHSNIISSGEAYTLGLLHDIGEFLLRTLFPNEMKSILSLADAMRSDREVALFGLDHCQIGQWILDACGMPRELTKAVQTHHDAGRTGDPVSLLLHVADMIACSQDSGALAGYKDLGYDRLAILGLTREDLSDIHKQVETAMEENCAVFA